MANCPNCRLDPSYFFDASESWFWVAFNFGVLCMLAIDLFGFQRKAHAPSTKEASITSSYLYWFFPISPCRLLTSIVCFFGVFAVR